MRLQRRRDDNLLAGAVVDQDDAPVHLLTPPNPRHLGMLLHGRSLSDADRVCYPASMATKPAKGAKKPSMVVPAILAVAGGALLFRGLYRPWRSFAAKGRVARCPGVIDGACAPETILEVEPGASIYAPVSGQVVSTGEDSLVLAVRGSPTVVGIAGVIPSKYAGDNVAAGQEVAVAESEGLVQVTTVLVGPPEAGSEELVFEYTATSAWLASVGARFFERDQGSVGWCAGGRSIVVPEDVAAACHMVSPGTPTMTLLPVKIQVE